MPLQNGQHNEHLIIAILQDDNGLSRVFLTASLIDELLHSAARSSVRSTNASWYVFFAPGFQFSLILPYHWSAA